MNERFEQMMLEATKDMPQGYYVPGEYFQKFAELIVQECCLVLEQTQTALDRHKWPTPSECGVYIKEHFGVEE